MTTTWGGASQHDAPVRMGRAWGQHLLTACPGLTVVPPKPKLENGVVTAYMQFYCPKRSDNGQGSVDFVKVIATNETAYMIAVAQRTSSYTSAVPGAVQFEKNSETEAFVDWLKLTGEYLAAAVSVCRSTESSKEECSK